METNQAEPQSFNLPDGIRQWYRDRYKQRCEEDPTFRAKKALMAREAYRKRQEAKKADPEYKPRKPGRPKKYNITVETIG